MSKLGLTVLFAMASAFVRTVNHNALHHRDTELMSLTKALHKEDWPQCRAIALQLARHFGTQEKIQDCLQQATEEIMHIFGDTAGFALMRDMKEMTYSPSFVKKLDDVLEKRINLNYQDQRSRVETVKYLSNLMFVNNWSPVDFDAMNIDCKRTTGNLSAEKMTPDEFLSRYRLVTIKIPPQTLSQA